MTQSHNSAKRTEGRKIAAQRQVHNHYRNQRTLQGVRKGLIITENHKTVNKPTSSAETRSMNVTTPTHKARVVQLHRYTSVDLCESVER
jgi:hypothetical protein